MKVLHVTSFGRFASLGVTTPERSHGGGMAKILFDCAHYAKKNGCYESVIACDLETAFAKEARLRGYKVEIVPSRWIKFFGRPIAFYLSAKKIMSIIKEHKIDVVHAYNFSAGFGAGFAAKCCKKPMFVCIHQDNVDYLSESPNFFVRALSWLRRSLVFSIWRFCIVPFAKKVLPVAWYLKAQVHGIGVPEEKIEVVYNGLDFDELSQIVPRPEDFRKEFNAGPNDFLVGSAGRLATSKGYQYLIEAACYLKDDKQIKFVVLGDGEIREELEDLVLKENLSERFLFAGQRENVAEILSAFDVFVLPSLMEGMPTAVMEAMFARVPVIATAVSGTPEIVIDHRTGVLIPPQNPESIVDAIKYLKCDHAECASLVHNSYQMVIDKFSISNKVKRLTELYNEHLVKGSSN